MSSCPRSNGSNSFWRLDLAAVAFLGDMVSLVYRDDAPAMTIPDLPESSKRSIREKQRSILSVVQRLVAKLTSGAGIGACLGVLPVVMHGANAAESQARSDALVEAWNQAALLDYSGAEESFKALLKADPGSRQARLGLAIIRLNQPPKSNARTSEIERELEAVRTANPDDDLGILAAYQLARIYHVHYYPPDKKEAAKRYEALFKAHPEHFLGQSALLRLETIELFDSWPPPNPDQLVAKWEAREDSFSFPVIRRNYLRKLGDAILWFGLPKRRALPLFIEANEIGFSRFDIRSLILLKIYNIATEEKMPGVALSAAKQFVEEFPRDPWTEYMRDRVAELEEKGHP